MKLKQTFNVELDRREDVIFNAGLAKIRTNGVKMLENKQRPDTPCVAVCSTTFDEVCRGCGRTVAEVADWVFMTQEQKDLVWDRILAQGFPRRNK